LTGAHTIELTPSERSLLAQIELNALALRNGGEHALANGELVCGLMRSLIARKGIPEVRAKFFNDPDYNIGGRGRSRRETFEKNGTLGDNIFRHPHFLIYLRYFLLGADLPAAVKADFTAKVTDTGHVTSSDVVPLGTFARQQARTHRLDATRAAEEFYKLVLDLGLSTGTATSIRNAVKRAR